MSRKTIVLNGVSGSGKSTIIKTLADNRFSDALSIISPKEYIKGTTCTNVKYTFGDYTDLHIGEVTINDFTNDWDEYSKKKKDECQDKGLKYDEGVEKDSYYAGINSGFNINNINVNFEDKESIMRLKHLIKQMPIKELLVLINKNKIDDYIFEVEIKVPILDSLRKIISKFKLDEISLIDTKGLGQDSNSRHLNFASIDAVLFISDGSKITDVYQEELMIDFRELLKSTPILISLRHSFDLIYDHFSGFDSSLLISTSASDYLKSLNTYCDNSDNTTFNQIMDILKNCAFCNSGILNEIVSKYAFNALPQDYSKDNSMPSEYAEKTEELYTVAVLNMIEKCLNAINEYMQMYNKAKTVLIQNDETIQSVFMDPVKYGTKLTKQMDGENRKNAKILRSYPDSWSSKYGWISAALRDYNYEEKRLRITLYNIVVMGIEHTMQELINSAIITSDEAEILTVYFSIQLKNNSEETSIRKQFGISWSLKEKAVTYLINGIEQEYNRLNWWYTAIKDIEPLDYCGASTLFELYRGVLICLQLFNFNPDILSEAMIQG